MGLQITEDDIWRVFHFECAAPGAPVHGLQARVLAPKRQRGSAKVEFQTPGSLTSAELDIITSTMRAANTVVHKVLHETDPMLTSKSGTTEHMLHISLAKKDAICMLGVVMHLQMYGWSCRA